MDQKKSIVIKVQYKDIKLKFQVPDTTIDFLTLKTEICQKLEQQSTYVQAQGVEVRDSDDFILTDLDKVETFLKDNDLIKLTDKNLPPDNIAQLVKDSQQEQQQLIQIQNPDPNEAIVVIYDISGSMSSSCFGDKDLSRIGAVNALFSAFADRTLAMEFNHIVKLVCFSSGVYDKCEFTSDFNFFIKLVDSVNPAGGTKCYDAIEYSISQLKLIKQKYPNIILRIIALTDGEDNQSVIKPEKLVPLILENEITIDSFVVSNNCVGLKQITHASGGRCYCPEEINQALQLFELETILSVGARQKGNTTLRETHFEKIKDRPFDTDGVQAAKPKALSQAVMKTEQIIEQAKKQSVAPQIAGSGASKRIYKELSDLLNQQLPIKVYPVAGDIFSWKVIMLGPKDCLYSEGVFTLLVSLPQDYPFKPPKIKFESPVYHCNVSRNGGICLDILKDQWSPALTVQKALYSIQSLLHDPNPDDALESTIASLMKHEVEQFKANALAETAKHNAFDVGKLIEFINGQVPDQAQFDAQSLELIAWVDANK